MMLRPRSPYLAALLVAALAAGACQAPAESKAPSSAAAPLPAPSASPQVGLASPAVEPTTPAAPATPPPAPTATSEERIAAALGSGAITYEESILYRALALFDSPGLPDELRSPVPDMHAATDLFGEVDLREGDLSAGLLEQLAPYRARPADPSSIFNSPTAHRGGTIILAAVTVPTWRNRPVAGGAVRVWVKDSPNAETQLTRFAAAVEKVWAAFPEVFTYPDPDKPGEPSVSVNPDGGIDFYFVDAGDLDPRRAVCVLEPTIRDCVFGVANSGYAQRAPERSRTSSSAYLVIDAASSGDDLLDTVAHELAHGGQFAYDQNESSWLMESTATWVAYRVLKKLGLNPSYAYGYLTQFFYELDQPLTRLDKKNAYASWLYFLFASMEEGDSVVASIWEAAAETGMQGEKAVDSVFSFEEHFDDFSVRDWNRDPVERQYKGADQTFPRGHQPQIRNLVRNLEGGSDDALDVTLPPLGSAYFEYIFQPSARDVTFENTLAGVDGAHVWAIKNIQEDWKRPEDWSDETKKEFCRDIPEEDVAHLILIVSNTSLTRQLKVTEPPLLIAGTAGCSGWQGTMTSTQKWDAERSNGIASSSFTGLWITDPAGDAGCPPGPSSGCVLFRPSGLITWSWDSHHTEEGRRCDSTKGGTLEAGRELHADQQVLRLRTVDDDTLEYWGLGNFLVPPLECSNLSSGLTPPRFFEILPGSSSNNQADSSGNSCWQTTWQIDRDAETIAGSCFANANNRTSQEFTWTLTRTGGSPDG